MKKLPKEFKEKWVKALRSGEYKQCTSQLHDKGRFCCLGVAAVLAGKRPRDLKGGHIGYDCTIKPFDGFPEILTHKNWSNDTAGILSQMNDEGKSFSEIADYIEKNL